GEVPRRLPGPAERTDRGQARQGRRGVDRRDVRRGDRGRRRRGARPHGGAAPVGREEQEAGSQEGSREEVHGQEEGDGLATVAVPPARGPAYQWLRSSLINSDFRLSE